MSNHWWESTPQTHAEPYLHILETDILKIIPKEFTKAWDEHMRGRTYMLTDKNEIGIYPIDYASFVIKFKNL